MIKKSLGAKMEKIQQFDDSTLIFDLVNNDNKRLTIAAVYAPSNIDNPHYFEMVDNCLQDRAETSDYQILVGDFNTTLDYSRDRLNYSKINDNHKKCRELINNWISEEKWVDIYDYKNPGKKSYTWESKTAPGKKGRIDHCLLSPNLVKHAQYVKHVTIGPHLTDHRAIELCLDWAMAKRGKGTFRAKQGLEKDPTYKTVIQRLIQRCLVDTLPDNDAREYLNGKLDIIDKHHEILERLDSEILTATSELKEINNINGNNDIIILDQTASNRLQGELDLKQSTRETVKTEITNMLYTIPDNNTLVKNRPLEACAELLEYIIHKVQRATISYMKSTKIKINNKRQEVVEQLDNILDNNEGNDHDLEVIKDLQHELDEIDTQKDRDFLSNKNSWDILEKEKNRKAFIKLESLKSGYHDPTIMKIYVKTIDMTIPAPHEKWVFSHYSTSQDEIKEEVKRTFQKINALQPNLKTNKSDILNFLNKDGDSAPLDELNNRKNKIPQHDWNNCNKKDFLDKELHDALFNHMNGSSSPGPDGFTVNWLRAFWPDLKDLTRNALNSSFGKGLTKTLRTAIIKILRKGDKDPMEASNYRPISLLSIFYKLASCVITRRIKPVVEQLIGKEQKAYIKTNNIGSCILNLLNMMKFANDKKKAWLILLIDFNKAFDSISHEFLNNTLELMGFGEDMREWIKIFFNNREANVLINGHLSSTIKLEQGVPKPHQS